MYRNTQLTSPNSFLGLFVLQLPHGQVYSMCDPAGDCKLPNTVVPNYKGTFPSFCWLFVMHTTGACICGFFLIIYVRMCVVLLATFLHLHLK